MLVSLKMKIGVVTICMLCAGVSTRVVEETETTEDDLPAPREQIKSLAKAVCSGLFNDSLRQKCQTNFLNKRKRLNLKEYIPSLKIKCQSYNFISFDVTRSNYRQLVTLVNDNNKNQSIDFTIIEPNQVSGSLYPQPGDYTFWFTPLDEDDAPLLWKRGPFIEGKLKKNREDESYDIEIQFSKPNHTNNDFFVSANVVWNSTESSDSFYVTNSCNKKTQGDFDFKRIARCGERNVTFNNLLLNDICTIHVQSNHNVTSNKTFNTPLCNHRDCILYRVENLTLQTARDQNNESWLVKVEWNQPMFYPDVYNVTLSTSTVNQSIMLPGNATGHQFKGVKGVGFYSVLVVAHAGYNSDATSARDMFPHVDASKTWGLLMGTWSAALLIVATLLSAIFCWYRRFRFIHSKNYIYTGDLEVLHNGETEGVEPVSEDQWEVRLEHLLLHEVIGEGAFGVVRRGTLAPANKDVAVKMLKDFPSVEEIRSFRAEMELMKSVGAHAHVVSLVGCCSGRRPLIIAEYCSRGDLLSYLRYSWDIIISRRNAKYYNNNKEGIDYRNDLFKNKTTDSKFAANRLYDLQGVCDTELTLLDLLSFCRQIAMGMEFLASNRVIHRDLAARNILVTADRTLKIADFGLSRDIYQENQYKQKGNGKMPVKWMALESLTHRIYTPQSDVWSFGIVMWEVVTVGGSPYAGVSAARLPRLLSAGYRMPRPPNCSQALYKLMLSCWNERSRNRPTFAELHAKLDELLCACADHYLCLSIPEDVPEMYSKPYRYARMLMRGKRKCGKSYEKPLATLTNHYTEQPVVALS